MFTIVLYLTYILQASRNFQTSNVQSQVNDILVLCDFTHGLESL